MPPGCMYVGRPSIFGNPFSTAREFSDCVSTFPVSKEHVEMWRAAGGDVSRLNGIASGNMLEEIRGKDLACWCKIDSPCHADVLLEMANR